MPIKDSRILICRTDNIGDVVLTLPITALMKRLNPSVKISLICRSYAAPIVRFCKTVDEVVEVEKIPDLVAYMRDAKFDTVVFSQPDEKLAAAAFKAGIPNRIGHLRYRYNWVYCNRRMYFSMGSSRRHEAQLNFALLKPMGIDIIPDRVAIPQLYQFDVPSDSRISEMLAPHAFNLIFHPKSNGHGREWPIANYLALAKLLAEKEPGVRIWVTGRDEESKWLQQHCPELLQQANVSNICGKFSLEELTILIKAADGLIASGTGPLHISAAIGQNTLGMFPPTRTMFPERWGTLGERGYSLCEVTSCEPCRKKKNKHAMTCECMSNIRPASALEIVSRWIDEKAGRLARKAHD